MQAVCGLWADCTDPCGLREESGRGEGNERGWRREGGVVRMETGKRLRRDPFLEDLLVLVLEISLGV